MIQRLALVLCSTLALAASAQTEAAMPDSVPLSTDVAQLTSTVVPQMSRPAVASQLRYAYLSYDSVFTAMPDYAVVQHNLQQLRTQYDAEAKRVEDDFNKKYEEFLDGQREFPQTILQKRQTELQELMDKNIQFKNESRRLLAEAERSAYAPLHAKLSTVLQRIGMERHYAFILNTDNHAAPFLNPAMGEDITLYVKSQFKH